VCGDRVVGLTSSAAGETCDDGDAITGDGCSERCEVERCGDGFSIYPRGVRRLQHHEW